MSKTNYPTINFKLILIYAFILEGAGYLVMPYISLHLRSQFHVNEVLLGTYFMIAIWLRPVWALAGSKLSKIITTSQLITLGAFVSGTSIFGFVVFNDPIMGLTSLVLANFGLALWNPSVYALVYQMFDHEHEAKKRVSQLNFAVYSGAAIGSSIASLLVSEDLKNIFIISSIMFTVAGALVYLTTKSQKIENDTPNAAPPNEQISNTSLAFFLNIELLTLILASLAFWASYAQFNSFFSLYASDWLKRSDLVGFAFSFMTIAVAIMSYFISRFKYLQRFDLQISIGILLLLGPIWVGMCTYPNIFIMCLFLIVLALSEAFLVLLFADLWAKKLRTKTHLMQSLNFAFCTIGMGAGSLFGGLFYTTPEKSTLMKFGLENLALCFLAAFALIIYMLVIRKRRVGI